MEQDLNRIKLVLVEKKKTGKWQPQEIGVSECTILVLSILIVVFPL